jgi:uncharacterized protein YxjI
MASPVMSNSPFVHDRYDVHLKIFSFPRKYAVYDPHANLVAYSKKSAFKLKEELRIYADEAMTHELLMVKARNMINFNAIYDITDSATGQRVGSLQRKGLKSLIKDEWIVRDANEQEIGAVAEDSMALALIRRFLTAIIPQSFDFFIGGQMVGRAAQNWNFFAPKMAVDLTADPGKRLDRRIALAAVMQLMIIEGRQKQED